MSEMKPCPFCGGEAFYIKIMGNYEKPHEIYCSTCDGGITEGRSKDGVIHNWNNRPIEDALQARIAELEAERRWQVVADGEFPELGEEVIFYDSIMKRRLKGCLRKNGGVEWLSDEGYTFSSRDDRYSRITHWMPLPKLPEVQE